MVTPEPTLGQERGGRGVGARGDPWPVMAGLRMFLAAVVATTHVIPNDQQPIDRLLRHLDDLGSSAAVVVFLAISGYSIAQSVNRPEGFLKRRFWRIAPTYYACLAVAVMAFAICGTAPISPFWRPTLAWPSILAAMFCLGGLTVLPFTYIGQAWSLACELVYYVLAPRLAKLTTVGLVTLLWALLAASVVHDHLSTVPYQRETWGVACLCLAWAWLAGFLYHRLEGPVWVGVLFVALITFFGYINPNQYGDARAALLIVASAVMAFAGRFPAPRIAPLLNYLGELSYPLYLVHASLATLLIFRFHVPPALALAGALAASVALYHWVDRPLRAWGRR